MNSRLLATKLTSPALPVNRVCRPQLFRRLDEGLATGRQIMLVSAPAGFGKTVCVADWISSLDCPVAWLALDPADDEPERFFAYLIAALQRVHAGVGDEVAQLLRAGQLPPADIISAILINDLLALRCPLALVLDDAHFLHDAFILHVLQALVGNLPPAVRIVLVTREDPDLPLARLRGQNRLVEIRAADLRLTSPEIESFLRQVMGLALSERDLALLGSKTEGWIVGLQLAGLLLRDLPDPSPTIERLSGANRFIVGYLVEEVLQGQPPAIQDFLLRTSILDRLTGPLCDALTGRSDGAEMLERLLAANLFLVPLDDEGRWYRYHGLFAELLRDHQRAQPEKAAELHRRASNWCERAGMANEAIEHALCAADYPAAVVLIEARAATELMEWNKKRVQAWIEALPPEWAARCPRTLLALVWLLMTVDPNTAQTYVLSLQALFSGPEAETQPELVAQWLALQASLLAAQGQSAEAVALCGQALALAPERDHQARSMIYTALASAHSLADHYEAAVEAYRLLIRHGRDAGSLVSEILGSAGLGLLALDRGRLRLVFEVASQAVERIERSGVLPAVSQAVYGELGEVYYQWRELALAHEHFQRAIHVATISGFSDAQLYYDVILSRLRQSEGDMAAAVERLECALALMKAEAPAAVHEEVVAQQVCIYLAQGRLADAEAALARNGVRLSAAETARGLASEEFLTRGNGLMVISALRVYLHRAAALGDATDLSRGVDLASQLIRRGLDTGRMPLALKGLLLRGRMLAALRDERGAQADTARAVELGEPENALSVFVEEGPVVAASIAALLLQGRLNAACESFARRVVAAFPHPPAPEAPQGKPAAAGPLTLDVEPLTERELDVLRLMVEGLTYAEIAARLFVSLNTVRSHVKSAYGKLGVDNRTRAVALAQQRGFL